LTPSPLLSPLSPPPTHRSTAKEISTAAAVLATMMTETKMMITITRTATMTTTVSVAAASAHRNQHAQAQTTIN
jgi:hypothetical protein